MIGEIETLSFFFFLFFSFFFSAEPFTSAMDDLARVSSRQLTARLAKHCTGRKYLCVEKKARRVFYFGTVASGRVVASLLLHRRRRTDDRARSLTNDGWRRLGRGFFRYEVSQHRPCKRSNGENGTEGEFENRAWLNFRTQGGAAVRISHRLRSPRSRRPGGHLA